MTLADYDQDEAYRLAAQKIGYGQDAPTYAGTYESQLSDLYDRIANRERFSYDVNADPLYQSYKDNYIQQGKLAMKDTIGQAAALTGGYGNTYGMQAGQQAYDAYLQNLSAVIPELYGMAYDTYRDEGDDLKDLYGMMGDRADTDYARYRDLMTDYNVNRSLVQQQEALDYNRLLADDERAYERGEAADKKAYDRKQSAYSNLIALIAASGYSPSDAELAAAGLTREAADALKAEYQRQVSLQGGKGTSGGGGGGSTVYNSRIYENPSDVIIAGNTSPGEYYAQQAAASSENTGSTYYPAEYERYLRNIKEQELGRMPTAGEMGWNDTAKMLETLGITSSYSTPSNNQQTAQQAAQSAREAAIQAALKANQQKGSWANR